MHFTDSGFLLYDPTTNPWPQSAYCIRSRLSLPSDPPVYWELARPSGNRWVFRVCPRKTPIPHNLDNLRGHSPRPPQRLPPLFLPKPFELLMKLGDSARGSLALSALPLLVTVIRSIANVRPECSKAYLRRNLHRKPRWETSLETRGSKTSLLMSGGG